MRSIRGGVVACDLVGVFGEEVLGEFEEGAYGLYFAGVHVELGLLDELLATPGGPLEVVGPADDLLDLEDVDEGTGHADLDLAVEAFLGGGGRTWRLVVKVSLKRRTELSRKASRLMRSLIRSSRLRRFSKYFTTTS
jgi:hypothetical protein